MLDSILSTNGMTAATVAICTVASVLLGVVVAAVYMFRNHTYSKNFVITLVIMPAMVQSVIMVVNGNLGAGVAVMGAFGLVRFRSVPGSAREIAAIFFSMAVGLSTGMGYIAYAALFTLMVGVLLLLFTASPFGERNPGLKSLRVVIPEDVDYSGLFDDLFDTYTAQATLDRVRTTNLGSLFELQYTIRLKDLSREKELIDKIRQRNGNLNITCTRIAQAKEEL